MKEFGLDELIGFQFIGFPSEWGATSIEGVRARRIDWFPIYWVPQRVGSSGSARSGALRVSFQFIGFPSEWGGGARPRAVRRVLGFQFIGFPSEWGEYVEAWIELEHMCFQFIGFPSEWGASIFATAEGCGRTFPIYWVPQRVGSGRTEVTRVALDGFQFIGFPSEWGGFLFALRAVLLYIPQMHAIQLLLHLQINFAPFLVEFPRRHR